MSAQDLFDRSPDYQLEQIVDDCLALIGQNPCLEAIGGAKLARKTLQEVGRQRLPEPLKLVLTSARAHRPQGYQASMAAMIVSAGIGCHAGLSEYDTQHLVLGALLHDIGEMYVNPEYLDDARVLRPEEWEHVVWHPCISHSFLQEFATFPAAINNSVLQHHERPDGHGYPFRLARDQIGFLGALLGTADTVAAIIMQAKDDVAGRVSTALRLLPGEFPAAAITPIERALANVDGETAAPAPGRFADCLLPDLQRLRTARREAASLLCGGHGLAVLGAADLSLDLLLRIDQSLRATGVYDLSQLDTFERNPVLVHRMRQILDEVDWRLRNLSRSICLHVRQVGNTHDQAVLARLIARLTALPGSAQETLPPPDDAWRTRPD